MSAFLPALCWLAVQGRVYEAGPVHDSSEIKMSSKGGEEGKKKKSKKKKVREMKYHNHNPRRIKDVNSRQYAFKTLTDHF